MQITALNFGAEKITGRVQSEHIPAGRVVDLSTRRKVGTWTTWAGSASNCRPSAASRWW